MKRKTKKLIRVLSVGVCSAMLLSLFPTSALDTQEGLEPLTEEETAIAVEAPTYSFLIQYDSFQNKEALLTKLQELEGELELEIDYMRCISARINMDQLAAIKEMVYVERVERNYDYNLLTEPDPNAQTDPGTPDGNNAEPAEADQNAAPALSDELRRLLAGEPPVSPAPSAPTEGIIPDESAEAGPLFDQEANFEGTPVKEVPVDAIQMALDQNIKGQNVKIALFDTGISPHPDYQIAGGISFVGDPSDTSDANGHGTQMAGIIAASGLDNPAVKGAAPDAEMYAVKLVSGEGFITTATILLGIGWAIENHIDIINMSFGTYFYSRLLEEAIDKAHEHQILMVGAVGNDGGFADEYRVMYPAAYEHVVAVGAGSAGGTENFSNNNEKLDFVAPGRVDTTALEQAYTHVVGTSASAAYVTGLLANLRSSGTVLSNLSALRLAKEAAVVADTQTDYVGFGEIRLEKALEIQENAASIRARTLDTEAGLDPNTDSSAESGTDLNAGPVKAERNSAASLEALAAVEAAALADVNTEMPVAMAAGNCFANEMASARQVDIFAFYLGRVNCPGNEVWYKFTTNLSGVHPNGGKGLYYISTDTEETTFDTQMYLYDASGNQLAYNDDVSSGYTASQIDCSLDYNRTYYVRVCGYGYATGQFEFIVYGYGDDVGNSINMATSLSGVYYSDQSYQGIINYEEDIDYYCIVPARDCVMQIYTEGTTDTYGTLYNECGVIYATNDNGNGNGNFKLQYELKGMQAYYISVKQVIDTGTGQYILKTKFIKDSYSHVINEQYNVVYWHNNDQSDPPYPAWPWSPYITNHKHKVFISDNAKGEYRDRVLDDIYNKKSAFQTELQNPTVDGMLSLFASMLIDLIPYYGSYINYAIDAGKIVFDGMNAADYLTKQQYIGVMNDIDGKPTQYIQGIASTFYSAYDFGDGNILPVLTNTVKYTVGTGGYYGIDYCRGEFIKVKLR